MLKTVDPNSCDHIFACSFWGLREIYSFAFDIMAFTILLANFVKMTE